MMEATCELPEKQDLHSDCDAHVLEILIIIPWALKVLNTSLERRTYLALQCC
jgi:hypothetical protein